MERGRGVRGSGDGGELAERVTADGGFDVADGLSAGFDGVDEVACVFEAGGQLDGHGALFVGGVTEDGVVSKWTTHCLVAYPSHGSAFVWHPGDDAQGATAAFFDFHGQGQHQGPRGGELVQRGHVFKGGNVLS